MSTIVIGHYGDGVARRAKRLWSDEEKWSICLQTGPSVSVAQVARRYAVNANLIFKWLRDPRFAPDPASALPPPEAARLLPIEIVALTLPDTAIMPDIDPDAFGILCRNLVENALRHGAETAPVDVTLTGDAHLIVSNDRPVLPGDTLDRLTARFERAHPGAEGSGLGLAIVVAIADRIGSQLILASPRPGAASGFQASLRLPTDPADTVAQDAT